MVSRRLLTGLLASAAVVSALTVLSRVTGFARYLVFSSTVGAGCVGDTYSAANLMPTVLFEVAAGGALAATIIPLMAPLLSSRPRDAEHLAGAVLGWTVLLMLPLTLAMLVLARPLAGLLVGGRSCAGQEELAAAMLAVFAPQMLLYGLGAVFTGILQAAGRFAWPAFAPVASSAVVILAYLGYGTLVGDGPASATDAALPADAFTVLAWGTTAGVAAMTLPLAIPVHRSGVRVRPRLTFPPGTGRRTAALAGAGVLAVLAQQGFLLAGVVLANHRGDPGTVVTLGYSQAVTVLPYAVLVAPLITTLFPRLSRAAEPPLPDPGFSALSARALRVVLVAGTGAGVVLAATAPGIAALFGALDRGRVLAMEDAVLAGAPGLIAFSLLTLAGRTLYAVGAPRAAAWGTSVGWGAAVVLAAAGAWWVPSDRTVVALAAGQSVGTGLGAAVLLLALRRRASAGATAGGWPAGAALVTAGLPAGAAGWWLGRVMTGPETTATVMQALAATVAGAGVALVLYAVPAVLVGTGVIGGRGEPAAMPEPVPPGAVVQVLGSSAGGIGRHVLALAEGLSAAGRVVVVAGPAPTLTAFDLAGHGVPIRELAVGDRPDPAQDLDTVRRLTALSRGAAVIHAHGLRAAAIAVLGARGVPVVVTVHNAPPAPGMAAVVYRVLERLVARRAAVVLAVSGDLGERMRARGARDVRRALVPSPVHPVPEADRAATRERVRAGLGLAAPESLAVTVARLAPQKGLEVLLEAADGLRDLGVQVVIAGGGPLHDPLTETIAERGLPVRLVGARDDVPDLLAAADLVIIPSLWEGQPLIAQEALAAAAAIVATDSGGTAEVVDRAAVLVRPGDPAALSAAVRGVLTVAGLAAELRERAQLRARELPTQADALAQVNEVYRRLAADRLEPRGAAHT